MAIPNGRASREAAGGRVREDGKGLSLTGGVSNLLLRVLPEHERAMLLADAESVHYLRRDVVVREDTLMDSVTFVERGLISVVREAPPALAAEIGVIGWDGLVGIPVLLRGGYTPHRYVAQTSVSALQIPAWAVRERMARSAAVNEAMLRYVQCFGVQVASTAFANAAFSIEARLARWLLMAHDRAVADELSLTHETLAVMLSVRRASVTLALHVLEGAQAVRSGRGCVIIRDRTRLAEMAGTAYGEAEAEYRRLIGLPVQAGRDA